MWLKMLILNGKCHLVANSDIQISRKSNQFSYYLTSTPTSMILPQIFFVLDVWCRTYAVVQWFHNLSDFWRYKNTSHCWPMKMVFIKPYKLQINLYIKVLGCREVLSISTNLEHKIPQPAISKYMLSRNNSCITIKKDWLQREKSIKGA